MILQKRGPEVGKKLIFGENDLASINPELAMQWHPTLNKPLSPQMVTVFSNQKVWWLCEKGHEWEAIIGSRHKGAGCPVCSGRKPHIGVNDLATVNPKLALQWHPTKNKPGLSPQTVLPGSGQIVWWQCENGHEWEAQILSRTRGNGCPYCSGYFAIPGKTDLAATHPDLAKQWHPTKNDGLQPTDVKRSSEKVVWWLGPCGHEWDARIRDRTDADQPCGCPYCAGKRVLPGFNDLATTHPGIAAQWHPTKNGTVLPTQVLAGSNKEYWWLCKRGHAYKTSCNDIKQGSGCPYCANKRVLKGFNDLASTHPRIAKQWHPTKNKPLQPDDITAGSDILVWWQCEKGHEWEALCYTRKAGNECPVCSGRKVLIGYNDLATVDPELALQWHPTNNSGLSPQEVTRSSHKKVWWHGPCGHDWEATIADRSSGKGCPVCDAKNKTSFPEKAVFFYISKCFADAISSAKFPWLGQRSIDIFIPSMSIAIEYDGQAWHKNIERDEIKNSLCAENGVRLIRIREPECPRIEGEAIQLSSIDRRDLDSAIGTLLSEYLNIAEPIRINSLKDEAEIMELIMTPPKTM